jgi:hypothetical protein
VSSGAGRGGENRRLTAFCKQKAQDFLKNIAFLDSITPPSKK